MSTGGIETLIYPRRRYIGSASIRDFNDTLSSSGESWTIVDGLTFDNPSQRVEIDCFGSFYAWDYKGSNQFLLTVDPGNGQDPINLVNFLSSSIDNSPNLRKSTNVPANKTISIPGNSRVKITFSIVGAVTMAFATTGFYMDFYELTSGENVLQETNLTP